MRLANRATLAEAAGMLAPLHQGSLDGLCGLYAVINAVRLVVYPRHTLRQPQLRRLFGVGLHTLSRARKLRPAMTRGIPRPLLLALCDEVVADAAVLTGLEVSVAPLFLDDHPVERALALRQIRRSLRGGAPVLIALMDSYNHSTVIAGYNRTRFALFDSAGFRWVKLRSLSFDGRELGNPHYVPPTSIVAVVAF